MRSKFLWILPLAFIAFGLGYFLLKPNFDTPGIEISPPDYAQPQGWAAIPVPLPPPVWEAGWETDVFLVEAKQSLVARNEKALERRVNEGAEQATVLSEDFAGMGPVYAPYFRIGGEADDLTRALNTYVDDYNGGRAFVIVTDTPLPFSILARFEQDPELKERFGGFVTLGEIEAPLSAPIADQYCATRIDADLPCTQNLPTSRSKGLTRIAPEAAASMFATLRAYLKANVAQRAEPLGDLEEIEIIEIRRPGDEVIDNAAKKDE